MMRMITLHEKDEHAIGRNSLGAEPGNQMSMKPICLWAQSFLVYRLYGFKIVF